MRRSTERLPGGEVEGVDHPEQRRQHEDMGRPHRPGEGERRQREGEEHGRRLGGDQDRPPRAAIGHRPPQRRQQEHRDLPAETHQPEQERGAREPIHEPPSGDARHPRSDQRNPLPAKEKPVIPVAQSTKYKSESAGFFP